MVLYPVLRISDLQWEVLFDVRHKDCTDRPKGPHSGCGEPCQTIQNIPYKYGGKQTTHACSLALSVSFPEDGMKLPGCKKGVTLRLRVVLFAFRSRNLFRNDNRRLVLVLNGDDSCSVRRKIESNHCVILSSSSPFAVEVPQNRWDRWGSHSKLFMIIMARGKNHVHDVQGVQRSDDGLQR